MSSSDRPAIHIDELGGLRGLLATWVVAGHALGSVGWRLPQALDSDLAVDVFIILSGFVIFLLLDRQRESYSIFLVRRFLRLFPVWWTVLLVSALLGGVAISAIGDSPFADTDAQRRVAMAQTCRDQLWPHVLVYVSLLQGIVPWSLSAGSPWCYVSQAWSISLEWQFYLVAPLVYWGIRSGRVLATTVSFAALTLLPGLGHDYTYVFDSRSFGYFATGISSYFLWRERSRLVGVRAMVGVALLVAIMTRSLPLLIWSTVFGSLLGGPFVYSPLLSRLLNGRIAQYLGEVSYSMYLTHMIGINLLMFVLNRVGLDVGAYRLVLFAAVPVVTLALTHAVHVAVERPAMDYGRRISRRSAKPRAPVAVDETVAPLNEQGG